MGVVQEQHYTIIKEPGAQYVNHVTPDDGSVRSITEERANCVISANSLSTLQNVICDSTAVNTGQVRESLSVLNCSLKDPFNG